MLTRTASTCALFLFVTQSFAQTLTIQTITDAWKQRGDRIRTFDVSWEAVHTRPKGAESNIKKEFGRIVSSKDAIGPDEPANSVTYSEHCRIVTDGVNWRYDSDTPLWSQTKMTYIPSPVQIVFDGKTSTRLLPNGTPKDTWSRATISDSNLLRGDLAPPLALALRPNDDGFRNFDISLFTITNQKVPFKDGVGIELVKNGKSTRDHIIVDPKGDFSLVQFIISRHQHTILKFVVSYSGKTHNEWIPTGWEHIACSPTSGVLLDSSIVKVTQASINNDTIHPDKMKLPEDTLAVKDFARQKMDTYIVHGATQYKLDREDEGKPGAEIAAGRTKRQLIGIASSKITWMVVLIFVGLSLLIARFKLRFKRVS
jgi:hypothetical protein